MKRFLTSSLWTWLVILLALLCLLAGHEQIRTVQFHQERLDQCTAMARAFHGLEDGLWNLETVVELRKSDSSPEVQQRMIQDLVRLKKSVELARGLPALLTENQGALIRLETILILLERNLSLESLDLAEADTNLRRALQETRSASTRLWQQYRDVAAEITYRWLEVNLLVLVSCLLAAFLAFLLRSYHRDLMERREAERALRESEDRYRSLVEVSPDAILVHRDGKILFGNSTAVKMLGAESARGLLKKDLSDWFGEENPERSPHARLRRPDGAVLKVEIVATKFAFEDNPAVQMVIRDITQQSAQTAALAASEERYRSLFENVSEGVYRSTPDGRILEANAALVRMLGYENLEELREAWIERDLYAEPSDRAAALEALHRDGRLEGRELRLRRRDGKELTVIENARLVRRGDGSVDCYEGTLTDITHRKLAEQALVSARDEALQISRLKSEFLANVSHEIRTPMNGIIGMSELLSGTELTADQREFTTAVTRSAQNLLNIINDVLDFSKIEAGRVELEEVDFSLRSTVEDVVELLAETAQEKGIRFGAYFPDGLAPTHRGDPHRIRQVLTNLVGNAIKFTDSGEVLIEVSDEGNGAVRISVLDTGIGIDEAVQSRLFQPFTQGDGSTTRRFGGTGLGLAISRQLVQLMGGRIAAQSRPQGGSIFWFELPLEAVEEQSRKAEKFEGCALLGISEGPLRRVSEQAVYSLGLEAIVAANLQEFVLLAEDAAAQGNAFAVCLLEQAWAENANLDHIEKLIRFVPLRERGKSSLEGLVLSDPCRQSVLVEAVKGLLKPPVAQDSGLIELSQRLIEEAQLPDASAVRLLVAEDNAINQRVAQRMLEKLGIEAQIVENGAAAIEAFQERSFPAILMDCQMPEVDGFQATVAIREWEAQHRLPRTPIIAMTAHALPGDRERCLAAGMDDYLSKPISLNALKQVLAPYLPASCPADVASHQMTAS